MMKVRLAVSMIVCMVYCACLGNDDSEGAILDVHKKVTDGLISIRKDYPESQPKVYALLDQVNKLFSSAKTAYQKSVGAKKLLQDKTSENASLKQELALLKGDAVKNKQALEIAEVDLRKKLEEEHATVERLSKEKKDLLTKVASLEDTQKEQISKIKKQDSQTAALEAAVKAIDGKTIENALGLKGRKNG